MAGNIGIAVASLADSVEQSDIGDITCTGSTAANRSENSMLRKRLLE
jgi:hypothetical protein